MKRMTRRRFAATLLIGAVFAGCRVQPDGPREANETSKLHDGVYLVDFLSDGSMFHLNETCRGKAKMTVRDGVASVRLVMPSKNVTKLFLGRAEDARKEGAETIEPVETEVVYDDGTTEEVYAFDVPLFVLDASFPLAIIGKKEIWRDHDVVFSNPVPIKRESAPSGRLELAPGEYDIPATLRGGSGRAAVLSPVRVVVDESGYAATLEWNSPHYDYLVIEGQKLEPINAEGNSVFVWKTRELPETVELIADTVAMSRPREIPYELVFNADGVVAR